jgi:hypothetical protein
MPAPRGDLRIPRPTRPGGAAPASAGKPAATVRLSAAAPPELRQLLAKYDFRSISPRQLAQLGGMLHARGLLSENAATSFIGVETNLAEPMDPDRPIDMVQHFQHMLDVALEAHAREPGDFDFAVRFRQEASQALRDVMALSA